MIGDAQLVLNAQFDDLERSASRKRCAACKSRVWVAWDRGQWRVRCGEGWDPTMERQPHYVEERMAEMLQRQEPQVAGMMDPRPEYTPTLAPQPMMTVEQFQDRQRLIRAVVAEMKDGVHYGVIPGTKDRSLWEPGAEYLRAAFNVQWGYEVIEEREDLDSGDCFYRFRTFQLLGPDVRVGGWEGSCWSKERKFWCHGGANGCPKNCAQTHPPSMERQMLPHNVRDRALKRAFVALIRNVTGTTGYFKGDFESGSTEGSAGGNDQGSNDNGAADPDAHPWLVNCPEHGQPWFKSDKMREPAHKNGSDWCNQSKVLKPLLNTQLEEVCADSWERTDVNHWLKGRYEGKTWSQLSSRQQLEAIESLKTMPPPSMTQETPSTDVDSQFEDV